MTSAGEKQGECRGVGGVGITGDHPDAEEKASDDANEGEVFCRGLVIMIYVIHVGQGLGGAE